MRKSSVEHNIELLSTVAYRPLPGHFNYSYEIQSRKKIVEDRIKLIVSLGK